MKTRIFRVQKADARLPWRVEIDGCTLSTNFRSDLDARRFVLRTERLAPRSTYDVMMLRNASLDERERRQYDQELRRRQDIAKYVCNRAASAAGMRIP